MAPHAARDVVRHVVDRVRRPRVLRDLRRVEVDGARRRVHHDVFQHRAEHARGGEDLRLALARQADDLGVAPPLEVEHAQIRPAVLIVADQRALRVGRERGLAGAREPEEQRGVAGAAQVGGAVHRQDATLRQQIIEDGEDRFLQLAGVPRAPDQDRPLREVHHDERAGLGAVQRRVDVQLRSVQHGPAGTERGEIGGRGPQEHVVHEQGAPRVRCDEADAEPVIGVRAGEQVTDEQLLGREVGQRGGLEPLEVLGRERLVHPAPRDVVLRGRLAHDELVVGAAAGMGRGHRAERPAFDDHALAPSGRVLVELGRPEVPVHGPLRHEPGGFQGGGALPFAAACGAGGHGPAGGPARGRRPCSCASTAAITAMLTMSFTSDPRCSTWTGWAIPTRIGPIASAPPIRSSSL